MRMTQRILLCLITVSIFGCGNSVTQTESSPSNSSSALFAKSFEQNLVSGGMSKEDAAFVASYDDGSGNSSYFSKASDKGSKSDKIEDVNRNALKAALSALSNKSHFSNAEKKKEAFEQISRAHLVTLGNMVEDDKLPTLMEQAAISGCEHADRSGLSGSDLKEALEKHSQGVVKGLAESRVKSDKDGAVLTAFTQGVTRGLANNSRLADSVSDLISAMAASCLKQLDEDRSGRHDDAGKGQMAGDMLLGVKNGLDQVNGYDNSKREEILSNVADSAKGAVTGGDLSRYVEAVAVTFKPPAPAPQPAPAPPASSIYVAPVCNYGPTYPATKPANARVGTNMPAPAAPHLVLGPGAPQGPVLHTIYQYEYSPAQQGSVPISPTADRELQLHMFGDTTVHISEGNQPIYLAIHSSEAIHFKITGAVNRIVKLYLAGYHCQTVEGVDGSKVILDSSYQNTANPLQAIISAMAGSHPPTFLEAVRTLPELSNIPLGTAQDTHSSIANNGLFVVAGDMLVSELPPVAEQPAPPPAVEEPAPAPEPDPAPAPAPPPVPAYSGVGPACPDTYDSALPEGVVPLQAFVGSPRVTNGPGVSSNGLVVYTVEQYGSYRTQSGTYNGTKYLLEGPMTINLASGPQIYLAVRSYQPVNIKLTGSVSRVKMLYVTGYHCARVEGIAANKVVIDTYKQNVSTVLDPVNAYMSRTGNGPASKFEDAIKQYSLLANVPLAKAFYISSSDSNNNLFQIPTGGATSGGGVGSPRER